MILNSAHQKPGPTTTVFSTRRVQKISSNCGVITKPCLFTPVSSRTSAIPCTMLVSGSLQGLSWLDGLSVLFSHGETLPYRVLLCTRTPFVQDNQTKCHTQAATMSIT